MTDITWEDFPWQQYKTNKEIRISADQIPGRIVAQEGPVFEVVTPSGTNGATPSGRLNHRADLRTAMRPAVGDYVIVKTTEAWQIDSILPRELVYRRKEAGKLSEAQVICANVDSVAIMTTAPQAAGKSEVSTDLADFSVRRIERYIATMDNQVRPIVVINKCDLVNDIEAVTNYVSAELPGIDVVSISALTGIGVDALGSMCAAGTTTVLVGSSGCGKSTLVNRLTGGNVAVGAIRPGDGRGRHITRTRRMHRLPGGGLLVDTPGMREVQLWADIDSHDDPVVIAFPEIAELVDGCKFADCRHNHEPGCAIKAAVQQGEITQNRYLSYLELRDEAAKQRDSQERREWLLRRRVARRARTRRRSRGG